MRRKDREITDRKAMEAIISGAEVCRIALCDGNEPYVVPVSFAYRDNEGQCDLLPLSTGRKEDRNTRKKPALLRRGGQLRRPGQER